MFLTISSYSFLTLYLSLELQGLALYILIALKRTNQTIESSLKYFIVSMVGTCFYLYGCAMLYKSVGQLSFRELNVLYYGLDILNASSFNVQS